MRKVCIQCCREYAFDVGYCDRDGEPLHDVLTEYGHDAASVVGRVLDGRYLIDTLLGAGGMGIVLGARHVFLSRRVAIKLLRPELLAFKSVRGRFFREARTASTITHPNVVEVIDFGVTRDDLCYLVMEYLDGIDLGTRARGHGPMPVAEVMQIGYEVARALAAIHGAGVVHRDLKPENVALMSGPADRIQLKVLDFGVAGIMAAPDGERLTKHGHAIGTPHYMSPEQCEGEAVDGRSDVYALGCIMWELAVGRPPFGGANPLEILSAHITKSAPLPSTLRPNLPVWFDEIVMGCMAKDMNDRWGSARELGAAIGHRIARSVPTPSSGVVRPRLREGVGPGLEAVLPMAAMDAPTTPIDAEQMRQMITESAAAATPRARLGNADPFLSGVVVDANPVPSTNISSVGLLPRNEALALGGVDAVLEVVFHWGGRYRYLGAEAEGRAILEAAEAGESVGRLFNRLVRDWPETETGKLGTRGVFEALEF